jgi:hypothetical protein
VPPTIEKAVEGTLPEASVETTLSRGFVQPTGAASTPATSIVG